MSVAGSVAVSSKRGVFVWTLNAAVWQSEWEEAKKLGEEGNAKLHSPSFDGGKWRLDVCLAEYEEYFCGIYLTPQGLTASVTLSYSVEIASNADSRVQLTPALNAGPHTYHAEGAGWGRPRAVEWSVIERWEPEDDLLLTITLIEGKTRSPPLIPHDLLNKADYCDVVFVLPASQSRIFALKPILAKRSKHLRKLLSSAFLEGSADSSVTQSTSIPENVFNGDYLDFDEFDNATFDKEESTDGSSSEEDDQRSDGGEQDADDAEEEDAQAKGDADEAMADASSREGTVEPNDPPKASPEAASASADAVGADGNSAAVVQGKKFHRIEVSDCSYSTLFAFVYFLYYNDIRFAPSHASTLASADDTSTFLSRADYVEAVKAMETCGPPPCSPHAIYRLADRCLQKDLRNEAKEFILEGLTPENAAYEAFSSLSRSYTEIQDGVVSYIVQNLVEVHKSRGWARAIKLLDEGKLVGGAVVLNKILTGVLPKKEEEKAKEAEK